MAALWVYVVSETVEKKLEVSEDDEDDGGRETSWVGEKGGQRRILPKERIQLGAICTVIMIYMYLMMSDGH